MADTYTIQAGDKYNPYTGKALSSSEKVGTVVSKTSTSSGSSGGSSSSKTTTTTPTQTYTVKAGDKYNPYTGEPLSASQGVGTVISSSGTSTTKTTTPTVETYTVKQGDIYNPYTGEKLTSSQKVGTVLTKPATTTSGTSGQVYYDNYGTAFTTQEAANTSNAQNAYYNTTGATPPTANNRNANAEKIATFAQENPQLMTQTVLPTAFTERLALAQEAGIQNYTGTTAQNAQIQQYQAQQANISNQPQTTATGANTGQNGASTSVSYTGSILQQGSRGSEVSMLQSALGITADGIYGPQTKQAVMNFQSSKGLKADGIVGPKTWAALSGGASTDLANISAGLSTPMNGQTDEMTGEPIAKEFNTGNPEIDSLLTQLQNSSPQVQWSQVLKQVYKDMGYNKIQNEYNDYNDEYAKLEDKKNDEVQDINNNPWYTEGEKQKRLQQLDKKYEGKEIILQNKIKLAETQIDNLRADAQYITSQTMAQVNAQAQLQQEVILKAIDIAEAQMAAESKLEGPASVQEYQYAVQQGYTGTFTQYQNEDANRKISIAKAGVGGLTPAQINSTVNSIAGAFDNEAVVKDYNTIKRQVDVFNSLGNSAVDDIQRVYAFAKIADPTSAVKEGEYNSIEKYSQALLQRSGLKVSRVFSATGILTPEARKAMSATIQKSLDVAKQSYDQVYNEYQRQIADTYAGNPRSITQYTAPTTSVNPVSNVENSLTFEGKTAYLPRSVWSTLGADMDELLADMKQQGYTLLITD